MRQKPIPSTGELLPVIGLGTNGFTEALAGQLGATLAQFTGAGGRLLDTAAAYGESEQVIGRLVEAQGQRQRLFIATKFTTPLSTSTYIGPGGAESFERSLTRLRTGRVDLLYVHNLIGLDALMPLMLEWRQAGRVRYLGVSSSRNEHHALMVAAMQKYRLDVVQVNYGLPGRAAETTVLAAAAARGVAVIANVPLGGRGHPALQSLRSRPLPDWAAELGCTCWPQLLLKYAVSHPAVTAVISGSTQAAHVADNLRAGAGALPDAALRRRMETYWETL